MIEVRRTDIFEQWLESIKDAKTKRVINLRVGRLERGNFGDCKSVGGGVSELRIHYGAGCRVYFTYNGKEIVLLLCGGSKSTQQKDIEKAQSMAREV